jgi:hypothetical protein
MSYQVHLTLKSRNEKTGPIPVSTTTAETCPPTCPLRKAGCYADNGPLGLFWRKVTERKAGGDWQAFIESIAKLKPGTLWRHNQSGDLPGDGTSIDRIALLQLVAANKGKRGFTYTHYKPGLNFNWASIKSANQGGFTVNLSANDLNHADDLAEYGIAPVTVILPMHAAKNETLKTPQGRKVVPCPATYRDDVTCQSCGLCAIASRDFIIGFPAHGVQKKKAEAIAKGVRS